MMTLNMLLFVVLWSTVYRQERSVLGVVSRTALAIHILVHSWSFVLVAY